MTPGDIDAYVRASSPPGPTCTRCTPTRWPPSIPDVILTQDLCRVCALPAGQVEDALDYLGCHADVVSLDPHTSRRSSSRSSSIGDRGGAPTAARELVTGLRERLGAVARPSGSTASARRRRRVDRPAVQRRALGARSDHRRWR